MRVIFMDVPGVLVVDRVAIHDCDFARSPEHAAKWFHRPAVQALNWLLEKTHASIAFTWADRNQYDAALLLRAAGVKLDTFTHAPRFTRLARVDEINVWLSAHPKVKDYVILDADSEQYESDDDLHRHAIGVNREAGLAYNTAEAARRVLFGNLVRPTERMVES